MRCDIGALWDGPKYSDCAFALNAAKEGGDGATLDGGWTALVEADGIADLEGDEVVLGDDGAPAKVKGDAPPATPVDECDGMTFGCWTALGDTNGAGLECDGVACDGADRVENRNCALDLILWSVLAVDGDPAAIASDGFAGEHDGLYGLRMTKLLPSRGLAVAFDGMYATLNGTGFVAGVGFWESDWPRLCGIVF